MKLEVRKNAKRNIAVGLLNKVILMLLPFVVRSVINNSLGADYLGLNSLFASIIQVLTLSELGFSSAMVYNMYKPIAENDNEKLNALLNLYKKAYIIIGIIIFFIGSTIVPFLPKLIRGTYPHDTNIYIIYIIQLINTSISYFLFAYRQSLLVAYQREDVNSIINLIVQLGLQLSQIVILVTTKNYYLYVICLPVFTIITNLWIGIITKKMFPTIKCEGRLDSNTLSDIKKLIAGTFIQKACAITRNSLDSICVSAFLGLALTAMYNNYYTIFNGITVILGIVNTSLAGGVGNHVAIKTQSENFEELKLIDFLYMLFSGWCSACLLCLFQPFMKLWMGEKMLLPFSVVVLMCLYFYFLKMGDMRSIYSAANGLWWKMKYRSIVETVCNVVLNIVLGKLYGIQGIVMATIISLFLCNFIWSSAILFTEYFGKDRFLDYFIYHLKYFVVTIFVCAITYVLSNMIACENLIIDLLIKGLMCVVIPALLFWLIWGKTSIFKRAYELIVRTKMTH